MDPTQVLPNEVTCGGCTVCCHILAVPDTPGIPKPSYQPCPWLHKGKEYKGCSIYADRPRSCRSFECHYIKLARRPDLTTFSNLRPDKSGVMIMQNPQKAFFTAHVVGDNRDAWKEKEVHDALLQLISEGFKVIISWGPDPKKLLLEKGERGSLLMTDIEILPEDEAAHEDS